eukprot:Gregarina_sp_Poly_1__2419@NODE_164_length_12220_cov_166_864807_g146_i0_p1_GENE_NODE_164_length_12220_cov_166_864807_g146_i0NODE_164_length_12220_cov_166_864807_g146_i0_p1_ORF_typecomplete_len1000_score164_82SAC3_GANP/PF03399_16/1_4e32SAC3_GANP/PF03399_16/0_00042CSN8_PSD8_EIF3K/PF10075_9/7_5e02CSN8_PSD8_EIF3K/PF10075_9/0_75_NODE_164_length_12220_cov_166_864807_g146_i07653764
MITPAATQTQAESNLPVAQPTSGSNSAQPAQAQSGGNSTNKVASSFNAPLEFFKMAMSMMGGGVGNSSLGLSPLSDPRLTRYAQAIKNFEVARQMQLWLANGAPAATAQANAETYVSRTLDNPPYSLYLYVAAARAMNLDAASGGRNFQASVAQGALELYSQSNAAASRFPPGVQQNVPIQQQAGADATGAGQFGSLGLIAQQKQQQLQQQLESQKSSSACNDEDGAWRNLVASSLSTGSVAPVQVPPPPPSEDAAGGGSTAAVEGTSKLVSNNSKYSNLPLSTGSGARLQGTMGKLTRSVPSRQSSPRFDAVAELKNISLPSNLATRVLATKWIQSTYLNLVKRVPSGMGEADWRQRLCTFIRTVVEGLARYPEEGCAMRWLSLPMAAPDIVIGVSDAPERFAEELPGFYGKPETSSGTHTTERKTLWVPPTRSLVSSLGVAKKDGAPAGDQDERSVSLSSLSSVTSVPTSDGRGSKRHRTAGVGSEKKRRKGDSMVRTVAYEEAGQMTAASFIPVSNSLPAAFHSADPSNRWNNKSKPVSKKSKSLGAGDSFIQSAPEVPAVCVDDPREAARRHARALRFSDPPSDATHSVPASSSSLVGNEMNPPHVFPFVISTDTTRSTSPSPHTQCLRPMTWQEKLAVVSSTKKVVGVSVALEKPYLRLCGPPDPALVRSESALHQSFMFVMEKFLCKALAPDAPSTDFATLASPYHYVDEQLRSIRQDFVVQGIQTPLLYFIYSINARISQIYQDLGQFNQCQSQMKQLERILPYEDAQNVEFLVYRLLYAALNSLDSDFVKLEMSLRQDKNVFAHPAVQFAIITRKHLLENNFSRYFRTTTGTSERNRKSLPEQQRQELQVLQRLLEQFNSAWEAFPVPAAGGPEVDVCKKQMEMIAQVSERVWAEEASNLGGGPPFLCRTLLRVAAPRFRMAFLCVLSKSHYTISNADMARWLAMSDVDECELFLRSQNAIYNENSLLDCRRSYPLFIHSSLLSKKVKAMG